MALIAVVWLAFQPPRWQEDFSDTSEIPSAVLEVDSSELVYTGSGVLDLLEGVHATDGNGDDLTDQVNGVITSSGTLTRKILRYSVYGENGEVVTAQRTLVLQNYTGPSLAVSQPLQLDSSQLPRLIDYLKEEGLLTALDGYGREITDQVTCVREFLGGQEYSLTFQVINQFQDSAEQTVTATISGQMSNPTIRLRTEEIQIPLGSEFSPWDYIQTADNGSGSVSTDQIQIQGSVNTTQAGVYSVTYRLYSTDGTARASATLRVTVG